MEFCIKLDDDRNDELYNELHNKMFASVLEICTSIRFNRFFDKSNLRKQFNNVINDKTSKIYNLVSEFLDENKKTVQNHYSARIRFRDYDFYAELWTSLLKAQKSNRRKNAVSKKKSENYTCGSEKKLAVSKGFMYQDTKLIKPEVINPGYIYKGNLCLIGNTMLLRANTGQRKVG